MKRVLVLSLVVLLVMASSSRVAWPQAENLSAGRGFGFGVRFTPQALVPTAPSDIDPALGSALVVQYWFNDTMGTEVGGWASGFTDNMNPHHFMTASGGLLYRLSANAQLNAYAAARALTMQSVYSNCCVIYQPPPPTAAPKAGSTLQNDAIAPPLPSSESHSSTLAVELASGIEQSWSPQVTTNFEVGLIYAQTMTTNTPIPGNAQPVPIPPIATSAASSFGIMLQVSLNFYLPHK
jgi:hypothetical protein